MLSVNISPRVYIHFDNLLTISDFSVFHHVINVGISPYGQCRNFTKRMMVKFHHTDNVEISPLRIFLEILTHIGWWRKFLPYKLKNIKNTIKYYIEFIVRKKDKKDKIRIYIILLYLISYFTITDNVVRNLRIM